MALFEPCLYFIFESYALTYTTASQAGTVTAMLPLIVAVSAGLALKEKTSLTTIIGFFIAIGGIVIMTSQSLASQDAPNPFLGNFLEFLAMCCAAGYTILARYLGARYSPFFLTAIQMFLGTLFFAPVLAFPSTQFPTHWTLAPTLALVYLGICVSFLAYGCFNYGLSKVPASQASAYVNLIPVISVICGWLILGERLTLLQFGGMGCVLLGVWISSAELRCRKLQPSSIS
jgi:drug/metabolite transporter (DMT)-like permease